MIYTLNHLLIFLSILTNVASFRLYSHPVSVFRIFSVPEWLTESDQSNPVGTKLVTVRFINTVSGKDVIAEVEEGMNLLAVGDSAGVKLPRACRTGLCGSCTCEIQDPAAIATSSNPRDGWATIRACSANCFIPNGMDEIVIDVHRMRKGEIKRKISSDKSATELISEAYVDPMARFSGDWEKEFRPQWELEKLKKGNGQVGGASDPRVKANTCTSCSGSGRVCCYSCGGVGKVPMASGQQVQCPICVGMYTVGCGFCQGTGKKRT